MNELTRIACVEDDSDIRAILEFSLAGLGGFDIRIFSDGASALAGIPAFAPQLILLDMIMPDMNGMEVLAALRQDPQTRKTPVIFMTAKAAARDIEAYIEAGAQSAIAKPFAPTELPENLRELWRQVPG